MTLMKTLARAAGLALVLTGTAPFAQEFEIGDLTIEHPQARPNMPNRPTAAYMAIVNTGEMADRLVSASSPVFGAVEIHTTIEHGDVMKMMRVDAVDIPAGETALLAPGGFHIMLFQAVEAHKLGEEYPLELVFEKAGSVEVMVKVQKITGAGDHSGHGGHGNHGSHGATTN